MVVELTGGGGIKWHEFFRGVDWGLVLWILQPPFIPMVANWEEEGVEGNNPIDMEQWDKRKCCLQGHDEENPEWEDEGLIDPSRTDDFSKWMVPSMKN